MITVVYIFFFTSAFFIFWSMIGYSISLEFLFIFFKKKKTKMSSELPYVTLMIVAHNEELVIYKKLTNSLALDYPYDKLEILIASDNSTDKTNEICENFILNNQDRNIRLYKSKKRMGKTNAQNEAQKTTNCEILVMTDANSILDSKAIKELVSFFGNEDVGYVCGRLVYTNSETSTAQNERLYWEKDLRMRFIESTIQTITAGNGAIYACRNSMYKDIPIIESHDSSMPLYMALDCKKALYNPNAVAFERAGRDYSDELKRKIRMNRNIIKNIMPELKLLNFIKYGWFTYFYLGHRTMRYLLWLNHFTMFFTSFILSFYGNFFLIFFLCQIAFFGTALMVKFAKIRNKIISLPYYYSLTIFSQWVGVFNYFTGKSKPFWEKVDSTRN